MITGFLKNKRMEPSTGRHNIGGVPARRSWIPLKDRETVLMMHEITVSCINATNPVRFGLPKFDLGKKQGSWFGKKTSSWSRICTNRIVGSPAKHRHRQTQTDRHRQTDTDRHRHRHTHKDRHRQTHRLEAKRRRVNGDVRNSRRYKRLTTRPQKCGKRDTQKALVDKSAIMYVVSAYVLCHVCAQIFFVVLAHYA